MLFSRVSVIDLTISLVLACDVMNAALHPQSKSTRKMRFPHTVQRNQGYSGYNMDTAKPRLIYQIYPSPVVIRGCQDQLCARRLDCHQRSHAFGARLPPLEAASAEPAAGLGGLVRWHQSISALPA